ncbi:MAG: hypothetical protein WCD79_02660, partial [Chthoniobacteraceae bacterium]
RLGTMPLAIDLQTLPLYIWERCHGTQINIDRDIGWILPWARAGNLVFWAILVIYVFRTARSLAGSWAGRIAAAFVVCEPGLLGHAALATTDISVTAMLVVFAFEFHAGRGKGWLRRLAIPSVLYGIAILAKASALVFAPVCMIVIEFDRLWRSETLSATPVADWRARFIFLRNGLWEFRRDFFKVIGLGLLVTFIYCGSDWTTEPTFITWAQSLKPGALHDNMLWISEHLRIFTNAGEGLAQQIKHNMRGHYSYILGQEHKRAVWYYFPVAYTIKCSIVFLLLPLGIAMVRRRALWNWPVLIAFVLLVYSVTCRVQLGIRFMFPLIALAAAGYGAAIVIALRENNSAVKRAALTAFVVLGLLYNGIASARVWPEGICYTNELWGGTRNGYLYLSDSNYDWGQGLPELLQWRETHSIDVIDIWYFGLDPRAGVLPLRKMSTKKGEFPSIEDQVRGKCVAVSTTLLYGAYASSPTVGEDTMAFFRAQKTMDRTTTYFIYDFRNMK